MAKPGADLCADMGKNFLSRASLKSAKFFSSPARKANASDVEAAGGWTASSRGIAAQVAGKGVTPDPGALAPARLRPHGP